MATAITLTFPGGHGFPTSQIADNLDLRDLDSNDLDTGDLGARDILARSLTEQLFRQHNAIQNLKLFLEDEPSSSAIISQLSPDEPQGQQPIYRSHEQQLATSGLPSHWQTVFEEVLRDRGMSLVNIFDIFSDFYQRLDVPPSANSPAKRHSTISITSRISPFGRKLVPSRNAVRHGGDTILRYGRSV